MMATQIDRAPHTTVLPAPGSSPTPPNSPPGNSSKVDWINLDSDNPFIRIGNVDSGEFNWENNTDIDGNPGQLAAKQFKVYLDEETAGYIITGDQQPLESEENRSYAPWTSKAEWELIDWLGTSQLLQGNIDKFLKLEWVSNVICLQEMVHGLTTKGLGPG